MEILGEQWMNLWLSFSQKISMRTSWPHGDAPDTEVAWEIPEHILMRKQLKITSLSKKEKPRKASLSPEWPTGDTQMTHIPLPLHSPSSSHQPAARTMCLQLSALLSAIAMFRLILGTAWFLFPPSKHLKKRPTCTLHDQITSFEAFRKKLPLLLSASPDSLRLYLKI